MSIGGGQVLDSYKETNMKLHDAALFKEDLMDICHVSSQVIRT